jgi:hypothetical protein
VRETQSQVRIFRRRLIWCAASSASPAAIAPGGSRAATTPQEQPALVSYGPPRSLLPPESLPAGVDASSADPEEPVDGVPLDEPLAAPEEPVDAEPPDDPPLEPPALLPLEPPVLPPEEPPLEEPLALPLDAPLEPLVPLLDPLPELEPASAPGVHGGGANPGSTI